MATETNPPSNVVILAHPSIPQALQEAYQISSFLKSKNVDSCVGVLDDEELRQQVESGDCDLVILLGGDGTVLRAGHICAKSDVPILGINYGRFGFLMEIQRTAWRSYLPRLLRGDFRYEKRMMLHAVHWRGEQILGEWEVLNEVVVCRGQLVKPLHLSASVDGHFLTTYVADGLIASTPTGSTAYALAAGGPILPPELRNILLIPVAPHLTVDRAIILSEGARVSICVKNDHPAVLSLDGQHPITIDQDDRVEAYAGDHTLRVVRFQDAGYFYRSLMSHMEQNPSTGKNR
jgi:NAD+ kinase